MKYLQNLGKAIMLPVACLPLCGILMGIGYLLCPASMQGGAISGFGPTVGMFLVRAGGALIDNIAVLFAIGIGVGMSDDQNGTAAVTAMVSWLIITLLLQADFVVKLLPSIAERPTVVLAFQKIQNPFIGILAGLIGAGCYNRFKNTSLPEWLAFFSRRRSTVIVSGIVSVIAAAILFFVWPVLFGALVKLGQWIAGLGAAGAGIYVIYSLLYGIFTYVTALVGFRAGFSFSAGATDLLFSSSLPAAANTWMILPLGLAAFVVFYVTFRFLICKFDLSTPGNEPEEPAEEAGGQAGQAPADAAAAPAEQAEIVEGVDVTSLLKGLGGRENILSADNCATRLRMELKDPGLMNEQLLKRAGAKGVIKLGKNSLQVIIGLKVQAVADAVRSRL